MQQHHNIHKKAPPSWWVRCAVLTLACLQVVAPTWHICPDGATGSGHGHAHACVSSQSSSHAHSSHHSSDSSQLNNQPMAMDYCLAKLLQHVLGNNQFQLILGLNTVTVSTLTEHPADSPIIRALAVSHARGPPSHLL